MNYSRYLKYLIKSDSLLSGRLFSAYITYQKIMNILQVDISIRDESQTERGRCIAMARDILENRTGKEAKYLLKVLRCAADNLNVVY